jgi:serralysin
VFQDKTSGFYAFGLTSDLYGPAVIFRGTDGLNPIDLFADTDDLGVGFTQFQRNWAGEHGVQKWLDATYRASGPIDFAGQSLGGTLTQWFASAWTRAAEPAEPNGKLIDQLDTFNSTGIGAGAAAAFDPGEVREVTHYVVNGDVVSMAGEAFIAGRVLMAS